MQEKPIKRRPKKIPVYLDRLPPCNNACPAGENIQAWLNHLQNGNLYEAWTTILENNPLPATHGRVCYHPCENACNRALHDAAVSIHNIERFLGDLALQEKWQINYPEKTSGQKVLVVGAGPAGLSAAYHLRSLGHDVSIYEANSFAGGIMHSGIPSYRLPRNILDGEIERIINMGITLKLNYPVTDLILEKKKGKFAAIFLAIGAQKDKRIEIPGSPTITVWGAIDFLKAVEMKKNLELKSSLVVYGGGNTAIDVARTAKRLGVKEVTLVYRRDRNHMPAFPIEVTEAEEENIKLSLLRTIKEINDNQFTLEIMALNPQGKPESTGKFETILADTLVLALGQDPDTAFLKDLAEFNFKNDGSLIVDEKTLSAANGIFAGGDMITDDRSVTIAVGHGKKAAREIDAYLRKTAYAKSARHELAGFEVLHLDNATNAVASNAVTANFLPPDIRVKNFDEVVSGIEKAEALTEANRCFSCGNCFECDGCYNICPVHAITKLGVGKRYRIDLDTCIGCAKCFRRCPCGAIKMIDNP
jgi:formate dehydrogenase (NADP+) beta subunit